MVAASLWRTTYIQATEINKYDHIKKFTSQSLELNAGTTESYIYAEIHSMFNAEFDYPKIFHEVTGIFDRLTIKCQLLYKLPNSNIAPPHELVALTSNIYNSICKQYKV